jgi:Uma2 family endonuclease
MASNPRHSEPQWSWPGRGGTMTEEEYHELERLNPDRKYEYINGMVYMMSGGTVGHDLISNNIRAALRSRLRSHSGSCHAFGSGVQVPLGVKKSGKPHFAYPDTTVSCAPEDSRSDNTLIESPRVVFEVLSPNTETKDRGVKFHAYQKCPTIQEIVLVNQYAPHVEIWQRDKLDAALWHYHHYERGETIRFSSLDVYVEIGELYQDLDFMQQYEDEEEDLL